MIEFANAVMGDDEARLLQACAVLRETLGDGAWHEAAATAANFNQMDRIADTTGIPSDAPLRNVFVEVGREIGSVNFVSAKRTLQLL